MVLPSNIYVKEHNLYGFTCRGIFTKETILKGEIVWKLNRQEEIIRHFTANEIQNHPQKETLIKYSYMLDDDTFDSTLDPEEDPSYFFNHSCEPNVGFDGDEQMIAIRDIAKEEHLVYDYAFTDTESSMHHGLQCLCGSIKCRGILTFGQWRSHSYMSKYQHYVTQYIFNKHSEIGWFDPRIERRFKDKERQIYGLFCRTGHAINVGEILIVFGGKVVHHDDIFGEEQAGSIVYEMSLQIHDELWQIQSRKKDGSFSETGDYINHSCNPNCGMGDSITVVAMHNIPSNQEITIDYAMVNNGVMKELSDNFECECESAICRGKVTSSDWKLPQVQQRYCKYFSPFVQRLIDNKSSTAEDSITKS